MGRLNEYVSGVLTKERDKYEPRIKLLSLLFQESKRNEDDGDCLGSCRVHSLASTNS